MKRELAATRSYSFYILEGGMLVANNVVLIKPCPFCGSTVTVECIPLWEGSHGYYGNYEYEIRCKKCGCTIDYHEQNNDIYRDKKEVIDEVIKLWNRRAN